MWIFLSLWFSHSSPSANPHTDLIAPCFYFTLSANEHWVHPNLICLSLFTLPITECSDLEGPWFLMQCYKSSVIAKEIKTLLLKRCLRVSSRVENRNICLLRGHIVGYNWENTVLWHNSARNGRKLFIITCRSENVYISSCHSHTV